MFSLGSPVIIGAVDVEVETEVFASSGPSVDYVEFFVDGESLMIDSEFPFVWRLDERLMGDHEVGVVCYGSDGGSVSDSVMVKIFNPF